MFHPVLELENRYTNFLNMVAILLLCPIPNYVELNKTKDWALLQNVAMAIEIKVLKLG